MTWVPAVALALAVWALIGKPSPRHGSAVVIALAGGWVLLNVWVQAADAGRAVTGLPVAFGWWLAAASGVLMIALPAMLIRSTRAPEPAEAVVF